MRTLVRELTHFVLISIAVVTVVSLVVSNEGSQSRPRGHGELSVTVILVSVSTVAVVQLLAFLGRSQPDAWRRVAPLWSRPDETATPQPPARLREWEATLVAATTGGTRLRQRLTHRLTPLLGPDAAELEDQRYAAPDLLYDRIDTMIDDHEESRDH